MGYLNVAQNEVRASADLILFIYARRLEEMTGRGVGVCFPVGNFIVLQQIDRSATFGQVKQIDRATRIYRHASKSKYSCPISQLRLNES